MKNRNIIRQLISMAFFILVTFSYAQKLEKIKGSKIVSLSEVVLDSITSIELYKDIDLVLKKGESDKLAIFADDNLHDVIDVDINNGKLSLSLLKRISSKKKFELTLYATNLEEIILDDNSTLSTTESYNAKNLHIILNNKSVLQGRFNADTIYYEGFDTSKVTESNFKATKINYKLKDRAKVKGMSFAEKTIFFIEGKNTITLSGKSATTLIETSQSANIKLGNLISTITELKAENSATVYVNTKENLTINASDDVKIYIYGKAEVDLVEFKNNATLYKKQQ